MLGSELKDYVHISTFLQEYEKVFFDICLLENGLNKCLVLLNYDYDTF